MDSCRYKSYYGCQYCKASRKGTEAIVKKQGIANHTLRAVYLASQHRWPRKQFEIKRTLGMTKFFINLPNRP